jgi:predicted ABC-type transport system involved in lysophospholipase L1 biosynthesis ATPase subunit
MCQPISGMHNAQTLNPKLQTQNVKLNPVPILNVHNVSRTYQSTGRTLTVLDKINFSVEAGTTMSIVGPSRGAKTTLLGYVPVLTVQLRGV